MELFPAPQRLRRRSGQLRPGNRYVRIPTGASATLTSALRRFCDEHQLELSAGIRQPFLAIGTGKLGAQQYELEIGTGSVSLIGGDEAGIFYGLATLGQLLRAHPGPLPCLRIEDAPSFARRGVMLDISRCKVPTLATLTTLIDQLARLKVNEIQLYTEHTFAFRDHRTVWAQSSPLTANDILAIKAYCQARYIDLVPNLNSFGHFERWLRHPAYHRYAECPEGFIHPLSGNRMPHGSTLKPNNLSLRLLRGLYDEYLPLFDSPAFNVGGDEPWELGHGWSRPLCEASSPTDVYVDFLASIQGEVEKRGRQMMFWSDIVLKEPASLKRLSKSLTAMNWGYEANHPFKKECEAVASHRLPFYVCPGTSSWNTLTGRLHNATGNLRSAARNGKKFEATGYLITDWGDHGHHQHLPVSYPGFLLGACLGWHATSEPDLVNGLLATFIDSEAVARLLLDVGAAERTLATPLRNATVFNRLLFWQMEHEPTVTRSLSAQDLMQAREVLDGLGQRCRITASDDDQRVVAELANAIDLARSGIDRLLCFRGHGDAGATAESLAAATGAFEALWLARNRPGGLAESVGHLKHSTDALQQWKNGA